MFEAALILGVVVVGTGLAWAIVYGGSRHSRHAEDDHEYALSLERARRREGDAARAAGGAVPAVPAREPGPRDPAIGIDQARADVRARIHRYNRREVRHGNR
jgi:hypothetical protein